MARIRTIKPSFFLNDELAKLPPLTRLLFVGLWTQADREGRLRDRPSRIKAEVLPYDECDLDAMLNDLATNGFILRYTVAEEKFIQVVTFGEHQKPHFKELPSSLPAPDGSVLTTVPTVSSRSGREGKGRERITELRAADKAAAMQAIWNEATKGTPLSHCLALNAKRIKPAAERYDEIQADEIKAAAARIAASPFCRGKNDRGWVADFDFFVRPNTILNALEGKYDGRSLGPPGGGSSSAFKPLPPIVLRPGVEKKGVS